MKQRKDYHIVCVTLLSLCLYFAAKGVVAQPFEVESLALEDESTSKTEDIIFVENHDDQLCPNYLSEIWADTIFAAGLAETCNGKDENPENRGGAWWLAEYIYGVQLSTINDVCDNDGGILFATPREYLPDQYQCDGGNGMEVHSQSSVVSCCRFPSDVPMPLIFHPDPKNPEEANMACRHHFGDSYVSSEFADGNTAGSVDVIVRHGSCSVAQPEAREEFDDSLRQKLESCNGEAFELPNRVDPPRCLWSDTHDIYYHYVYTQVLCCRDSSGDDEVFFESEEEEYPEDDYSDEPYGPGEVDYQDDYSNSSSQYEYLYE